MNNTSVWDKTFTDASAVSAAPVEYEAQPAAIKPGRPERNRQPQRNDERYEEGEGDLKWSSPPSRPRQTAQRLDERYEGDYETPRARDDRRYERVPTRREPIPGKKTYLWAAGYALTGVAVLLGLEIPGVDLSSGDAMGMIWEAGAFVFVRLGISKIFKSNN